MGGRLSRPSAPDALNEAPITATAASKARQRRPAGVRALVAPLSVVVFAGMIFVYSRTTVQAAKVNAKRHREADGGSINWRNETMRRHGVLQKPEERTLLQQLFAGKEKDTDAGKSSYMSPKEQQPNFIEEGIRQARDKGKQSQAQRDRSSSKGE